MSNAMNISPEDLADAVFLALETAIAPLADRIAALEARPSCEWKGVYQPGVDYIAGSLVTRRGSLWYAVRRTASMPGDAAGAEHWRLIVKSGAEGLRE